MSDAASSSNARTQLPSTARKNPKGCWFHATGLFCIAALLFFVALGPMSPGIRYAKHNAALQQAHVIGLCLFAYATDNTQNGNAYPEGKSSTEVFQKLIDGGYVSDPAVFYVPLPGKVKAVAGQKLKPENICWDVTVGVDSSAPDHLPLVFMTGYKVNYVPGGSAVPIIKPYPHYWSERTWSEWWEGGPPPDRGPSGIAVFYTGNRAMFQMLQMTNSDGSIPNFVPSDFKPEGKAYRQLTPEGPVP